MRDTKIKSQNDKTLQPAPRTTRHQGNGILSCRNLLGTHVIKGVRERKIFAHMFNAFKMTLIKCTPVWRSEAGLGSSHNVGPGDRGPGD